jgi:hypothetical protein
VSSVREFADYIGAWENVVNRREAEKRLNAGK